MKKLMIIPALALLLIGCEKKERVEAIGVNVEGESRIRPVENEIKFLEDYVADNAKGIVEAVVPEELLNREELELYRVRSIGVDKERGIVKVKVDNEKENVIVEVDVRLDLHQQNTPLMNITKTVIK